MYTNYFMVDEDFLAEFLESERTKIADVVYGLYLRCGGKTSKKLSMEKYFSSTRTRYPVVYFFCPKCKKAGFLPRLSGKKSARELKYCPFCGEPNICYRFETGRKKIIGMLQISKMLEHDLAELAKYQNQQLIVLICSVLEVYLREFYADILNAKFVMHNETLYDKFLRDCKNDFLNPGKTQDRLKRELGINYKGIVGGDVFKILQALACSRNVIVHNNGICDDTFIKQYPEIELRAELAPKCQSVEGYLQIVDFTINKLDEIYRQAILKSAIGQIKYEVILSNIDAYIPSQEERKI